MTGAHHRAADGRQEKTARDAKSAGEFDTPGDSSGLAVLIATLEIGSH